MSNLQLKYEDNSLLERLQQYYLIRMRKLYKDPVICREKAYEEARREIRNYDDQADRERTYKNFLAWNR